MIRELWIQAEDESPLRIQIVEGDGGKSAILLHGLGETSEAWLGVGRYLSRQGFTVILPDLRGHGGSRSSRRQVGLEVLARDLKTAIEELGLSEFHAIGFSLGGYVILQSVDSWHLQDLGLESAVIISAAHKVSDPEGMSRRASLAREGRIAELAREIASNVYKGVADARARLFVSRLFERVEPKAYAAIASSLARRDFSRPWKILTEGTPTTIVLGRRDPLMGREILPELLDITGSRGRVLLVGTGHMIHIESPKLVREILTCHLSHTGS